MKKPGQSTKWIRQGLRRVRQTRVYHRYVRPAVSLLRWEGVILVGALGFGVVSAFATRWFILFVFLSAALLGLAWVRAFDEGDKGHKFRRRAQGLGLYVWGLLLLLVGLAIFWRFTRLWGAVLFAAIYVGVMVWHLRWLRRLDTPIARQFKQIVSLSVTPVFAAWVLNSTAYLGYARVVSALSLGHHDNAELSERKEQRRQTIDAWESEGSARVAVALSGGGYRAAVVHAGILSGLDGAGVPISYLSTVSGGSIVGGAYALGWSPEEFCEHLKKNRPGLTNDLANFYPVFKQFLFPRYNSGDTYSAHFDRVYFHGHRLQDTGPPLLILNSTHYHDGERKAFRAENEGQEILGRVVAASGAFPVAFDPVRIGGEPYVDGGVVENLGIAGLQHYFRDHAGDADLADRLPGVLIISDMSLIPDDPVSWKKPSLLRMALRAQHASYFAMHQWIYSFYTDGAYDRTGSSPLQQPYAVEAGRLWPDLPKSLESRIVKVFVLSPTSPAERRHFDGHEDLVEAVSSMPTLQELARDEVDAAFWMGARLAQVYAEDICAAVGSDNCRPVEIPDAPPVP
ncbi:MAG: patatin-like phospholipase family protein [Planctomycetota bacterium]|jgi:predicted acylesterase/phospholipase RssA